MNLDQLLAWLNSHQISVVEKVKTNGGGGKNFLGDGPFSLVRRPPRVSLPVKNGQKVVAMREIEALIRHFTHGELEIPKPTPAIGSSLAMQPLHKKSN